MKTFNKYSLYILTAYGVAVAIAAILLWQEFTLLQKCVSVATVIVVLHEWEEQRYPGGFLEMMASIMGIDVAGIDFHDMYAKPDILIFVLTILALVFPSVHFFGCAVIIFGVFEGILHIMGIRLGKPDKPYTPGMFTGEAFAVSSIVSIVLLATQGAVSGLSWLVGLLWLFLSFAVMELSVWRAAGLGPKDVKDKVLSKVGGGLK